MYMSKFKIGDEVVIKKVNDKKKANRIGDVEKISGVTEGGYKLEGYYNFHPVYWEEDELELATSEDKLNEKIRHIYAKLSSLASENRDLENKISELTGKVEKQKKYTTNLSVSYAILAFIMLVTLTLLFIRG